VHVVNDHRDAPFIPVRDIPVALRVPEGERVSRVESQTGREKINFQQHGAVVSFVVPDVHVYQAFVLSLA
jgi:hypothetical protein